MNAKAAFVKSTFELVHPVLTTSVVVVSATLKAAVYVADVPDGIQDKKHFGAVPNLEVSKVIVYSDVSDILALPLINPKDSLLTVPAEETSAENSFTQLPSCKQAEVVAPMLDAPAIGTTTVKETVVALGTAKLPFCGVSGNSLPAEFERTSPDENCK